MAWTVAYDHLDHKRMSVEGGITVEGGPLPSTGELIKFKLFDDDMELYYSGTLHDDDECLNQESALSWGEYDAGCTTIMVERDGVWVVDLG
jgi:hypothetical protein